MQDTETNTDRIARLIENIEGDLRDLRQLVLGDCVSEASSFTPHGFMQIAQNPEDESIEGIFDGERMIDASGKSYQVPPNYASKSKLVEGDPLKLYITHEGKYVYKQLGPVERYTVPGTLRMEGNHYVVDTDEGQTYSILTACVTYYMSLFNTKPGDRVMLMLPSDRMTKWGVIDNVI